MENLILVLKKTLLNIINDIDTGNSNISEDDANQIIAAIRLYSHKDQYYTKYQACKYLNNISRATFDNLVHDGKLPHGVKLYAGDNNLFWKVSDLMTYRNNHNNKCS